MSSIPSVSQLKAQAARLEQFLAAGGLELKHTHALEALAKVYGVKDWHTLSAMADRRGFAEMSYAVVTLHDGQAKVSTTTRRDLALRDFLASVRTILDVLRPHIKEFSIDGQDIDDGLPMLSFSANGIVYCSLQQATRPDTDVVVGGRLVDGPLPVVDCVDEATSFVAIGKAVTAAFQARPAGDLRARQEAAGHSRFAYLLEMDFNELAPRLREETEKEFDAPQLPVRPEVLLKQIDSISLQHGFVATVR